MPVGRDIVGLKPFVALAVMDFERYAPPRPRNPRFCVDNDRIKINEFILNERRNTQNRGGRVTAGIADQVRFLDLGAEKLRQAENRLLQIFFRRVFNVIPFLKDRVVGKTIIRAEINDFFTGVNDFRDVIHGDAVGQSKKYQDFV